MRKKNIIEYKTILLEKSNSIDDFHRIFPCTVCSIQDLYDVTSLKNNINIDLAADLIYNLKRIKIFLSTDDNIKTLFVNIFASLEFFGLKVDLYDLNADFCLEKNDSVIILSADIEDEIYKNFLKNCIEKEVNVVNILPEKINMMENKCGLNLFYLSCKQFDEFLCIEILLRCLYLGVLTKIYTQN